MSEFAMKHPWMMFFITLTIVLSLENAATAILTPKRTRIYGTLQPVGHPLKPDKDSGLGKICGTCDECIKVAPHEISKQYWGIYCRHRDGCNYYTPGCKMWKSQCKQ